MGNDCIKSYKYNCIPFNLRRSYIYVSKNNFSNDVFIKLGIFIPEIQHSYVSHENQMDSYQDYILNYGPIQLHRNTRM